MPRTLMAMTTGTSTMVVAEQAIPLTVATTAWARARGLLGRDGFAGALLLPGVRAVHTFGMRFAIDVAHLDVEGRVLCVTSMPPRRLGGRVRTAAAVLEAEAGAFARWGLRAGERLGLGDAAATAR